MDKPRNVLILMVGLPHSGKTTAAQDMGHPIVSPDAIRVALHGHAMREEVEPMVWGIAHTMVIALFCAGHRCVILDACNHMRKFREDWKSTRWRRQLHVVSLATPGFILRSLKSRRYDLVPIIEQMAKEYEEVETNELEGGEKIVRYTPKTTERCVVCDEQYCEAYDDLGYAIHKGCKEKRVYTKDES